MTTVEFQDLGNMPYRQAWDYQSALHREMTENKLAHRGELPGTYPQRNYLLLVEHPPVYTLGKSGSMDNLLLTEQELTERGIDFYPINRGGDITFHGPGQIVGYPVLDLELFFTDVHRYVRNLEEIIIRTLADYGLAGFRITDYTGVWLERPEAPQKYGKICAIGVHISRWVTLHGWAFNVNTPLEYFNNIVPCGIADPEKTVTSLSIELGRDLNMEEVKSRIRYHFEAVFETKLLS